jgi:hypothetical protein
MQRPICLLSVDLEDYRRQELRDHLRSDEPAHPREIERQLDTVLELLDSVGAQATFFSVGRLAVELAPDTWREITDSHRLGCHGYEHLRAQALGPAGFERDLRAAKTALEDAADQPVVSYRSPYFSGDHCDPWYGEVLAGAGFVIDSSRRLRWPPSGFSGTVPLAGSGAAVREVPLPSIGIGPKRFTVIGGTYFRLLPLPWIVALLEAARKFKFFPTIYLHPYDFDATAAPLDYDRFRQWWPRLGDRVRRIGRTTAADKLRILARTYDLRPIESLLMPSTSMTVDAPGTVADRRFVPDAGPAHVFATELSDNGTIATGSFA